jgi:hypothetical protein
VAGQLLAAHYAIGHARQFAGELSKARADAIKDLRMIKGTAIAAIDVAQALLVQNEHYIASLNEIAEPRSPNQNMFMNDEEAAVNGEQELAASDSQGASRQIAKRRALGTGPHRAITPARSHRDRELLQTIDGILRRFTQWPLVSSSGLSGEAATLGASIEAVAIGAPRAALEMVVRSLYGSHTRAFNEYADWLALELAKGPPIVPMIRGLDPNVGTSGSTGIFGLGAGGAGDFESGLDDFEHPDFLFQLGEYL